LIKILLDEVNTESTSDSIQWLLEVGHTANASFVGGNYQNTTETQLYVGPGDYSTLINGINETNSLTLSDYSEIWNTVHFRLQTFQIGKVFSEH